METQQFSLMRTFTNHSSRKNDIQISMKKTICYPFVIYCIGAILIVGCASPKPFKYHPDTEIPEGPGLFTKEAGALVLYKSDEQKVAMPAGKSTANASNENTPGQDATTYKEYENWRQEQKEFQEFLRWKQSEQNKEAYQEFLEWKRWKAYKAWQENQQQKE